MFFRKCQSKHKTLRRIKPLPFHRFCLNVRLHFHVTLGSKLLSYETRLVTFPGLIMTRLLSSVSHKIQTSSALKAISLRSYAFHQLFTPKWLRSSHVSITRARQRKISKCGRSRL